MDRSAVEVVQPYEQWLARPIAAVVADLESFCALLRKWQRVQNLVSRETLDEIWTRHIGDSLQVLPLLGEFRTLLDLGSGGGLPAVPLAIARHGTDEAFILVEPNGRKASFLKAVSRDLDLPLRVENRRVEAIPADELPPVDVISSRALAPLTQLCTMAAPFFGPNTRAILHKGREHVDELSESRALWHHDVVITKSVTDSEGALIELRNLRLKTAS